MNRTELSALGRDPSRRQEFMDAVPYMRRYDGIDFRAHPELYLIGRGEQGVLMAEPYKSEILPHWAFRTPNIASVSSAKIEAMFRTYLRHRDFVGADVARKYLQMGWTRARRYANHPSGRKYRKGTREVLPQAADHSTSPMAESAAVFKAAYDRARANPQYLRLRQQHKELYENPESLRRTYAGR